MNRNASAEKMRPVIWGAAILFLCLFAAKAGGQRREAPHSAPPPRFSGPRSRPAQPQEQRRMEQPQGRFHSNPERRPESNYRPAAPGQYPNANFNGGYTRPAYPGAGRPANPAYAPPGHLQSWLNQHRGLPLQDQERLLRNDPSFNHLPTGQQQRLVQQLHQVDQMPEQQRERRLERSEMLERLSPQDRMNLNSASRQFGGLPQDRQQVMKQAFRDLRSVPPDQRQTVLNSARYQNNFSPQERDILSNFLRVEPYEPPH